MSCGRFRESRMSWPSTSSSPPRPISSHSPGGWRERSPLAGREGPLTFRHFDLYSQALAKLERRHAQDVDDLQQMLDRGLVEKERLRACFSEIESQLYRFPAIDAADFRRSVEEYLGP
jgi:hypothetical protein